jgi:hypothetical protein
MTVGQVAILVPTAAAPTGTKRLTPPPVDLAAARCGFRIEGSTPRRGDLLYRNFLALAERLQERLTETLGPRTFSRLGQMPEGGTAPELFDHFAAESDCAVLGIAG